MLVRVLVVGNDRLWSLPSTVLFSGMEKWPPALLSLLWSLSSPGTSWRLPAILLTLFRDGEGTSSSSLVLALVSIFPRNILETACNTTYRIQGRRRDLLQLSCPRSGLCLPQGHPGDYLRYYLPYSGMEKWPPALLSSLWPLSSPGTSWRLPAILLKPYSGTEKWPPALLSLLWSLYSSDTCGDCFLY